MEVKERSPAGADWPQSLYDVGNELFVGYLEHTTNKTQIDLGVKIKSSKEYFMSGEAKNYATKISLDVVKGCLLRMKSRIHFCIVSQLQKTYFTKKTDAWESFKTQKWKLLDANVNVNVQKVNVLRVKVNKPLFTIELHQELVQIGSMEGIVVFMDMNDLIFMDLKHEQCTITAAVKEKRGRKSSS